MSICEMVLPCCNKLFFLSLCGVLMGVETQTLTEFWKPFKINFQLNKVQLWCFQDSSAPQFHILFLKFHTNRTFKYVK